MISQVVGLENKVKHIILNVLKDEIAYNTNIEELCNEIFLKSYSLDDNTPKILIVYLKKDLIKYIRVYYKEYLYMMKQNFTENIILTVRNESIDSKKGLGVSKQREEILQDLCFPGVIKGRSQEVEDRNNVIQKVYLDYNQRYWSDIEMKAIEKLANEVLQDNYVIDLFSY